MIEIKEKMSVLFVCMGNIFYIGKNKKFMNRAQFGLQVVAHKLPSSRAGTLMCKS